ncbi:hypothetical protein N1851_027146 [Merluccius polli]|uniref:Ig-like domain-containing protein n=1 Tax=Merluccius polli TaxID=89951 RepID=A0AA47MAJ2_MERPO|nr:hypothetical protein N1851_027146 [Merluccius polli]
MLRDVSVHSEGPCTVTGARHTHSLRLQPPTQRCSLRIGSNSKPYSSESNVFTPQRIIIMSWMCIFLPAIWGAVVSCQDILSNTEVELTVRPGENVTLYCDCKLSTGKRIVWYRNCSHDNQPTFTLKWNSVDHDNEDNGDHSSHLHLVWNDSSNSFNLLIKNITDSHLGLYYCGTEEVAVIDEDKVSSKYIHTYGNVTTRISFDNSSSAGVGDSGTPDCGQCWMLLVILCPSSALLLSLLSSSVVYLYCRKTDEDLQVAQRTPASRDITSIGNQDEDGLCYATLDIPRRSQRPKMKRVQTSEFSTYSAINT